MSEKATVQTDELLVAIQRARSDYDWPRVRDLATQILEQEDVSPETAVDALRQRAVAEDHLALLDEGGQDLEEAVAIAQQAGLVHLQIDALNDLASHLSHAMVNRAAGFQVAEQAFELAQQSGTVKQLADSHVSMSDAFIGDNFDSVGQDNYSWGVIEYAERALSLARKCGNKPAQAASTFLLGEVAVKRDGDTERAEALIQESLSLYQQTSQFEAMAAAHHAASSFIDDLNLKWLHNAKALQLSREINHLPIQLAAGNNRAFLLWQFGLYHSAEELASEVVRGTRKLRLPVLPGYVGTLVECRLPLGKFERIPMLIAEMQEQVDEDNGRYVGYVQLLSGLTSLGRGDFAEASKQLQLAAFRAQEAGKTAIQATALTWLGAAQLASGKNAAAFKSTGDALAVWEAGSIYSAQESYWWHYRTSRQQLAGRGAWQAGQIEHVFEAAPLPDDVFGILDHARQLMLDYVGGINDEGLRRNYLNKVPINRDITLEWTRQAVVRGESLSPFTKRETSSTSFAEQFQRLVEIGNRLTAERDPQTLPETIRNEFVELSGAERAIVALRDEAGDLFWATTLGIEENEPEEAAAFISPYLDEAKELRTPKLRESEGNVPDGGIPELHLRSVIALPLISQGRLWGVLYGDMRHIFGRFNEQDLALLNLLANQAAAALENADWVRGLEEKVEERTAELQTANASLEGRNAELAVINSIQEGLVAQTDMQGIYELVGDKINELFPNAQSLLIATLDVETKMRHIVYMLEDDQRFHFEPESYAGKPFEKFLAWQGGSREPLVINENMAEIGPSIGITTIEGTEPSKSMVAVPLFIGGELKGAVSLQDTEREHAFSAEDVRLLTTITNAMGVALESARLFEAEQQRVAELQIINSVQAGLVAQMDMQGIYDQIGEKLVELFPHLNGVTIATIDPERKVADFVFIYEEGQRHTIEPMHYRGQPYEAWVDERARSREIVVVNENEDDYVREHGLIILGDTAPSKSSLFVPLLVGNQVSGYVSLHETNREHAFSDDDVRLLTTITNAMSVALESARLFDETQRLLHETEARNAELAIINSIQAGLVAQVDIQGIYDLVGDKLVEIFPDASSVGIQTLDTAAKIKHEIYVYEDGERFYFEPESYAGLSYERWYEEIARSKQPQVVNENTAAYAEKYGMVLLEGTAPVKSMLEVPLIVGDNVIGIVGLQDMEKEHAFSEEDVRLLTTIANAMSVALENARLFDETQRLLKETEGRNAELSAVSTVSQALVAEPELENLIQLIGDQMRDIFRADIVYLALLDQESRTIHFPYQYGEQFDTLPLGEGLTSRIIASGEPLLINRDIDERHQALGTKRVGVEARSYLGVPIKVGQRNIGVLSVQSTQREDYFDQAALNLLTTIAANAGAAIENARLFREAQEARRMADEANAAKSTFLANMSHELRTPLNSIIGFTRIVKRKAEGALPEKQIDNLRKVQSSAEHLLGLINTILDLAKIEAGRVDVVPEEFALPPLIDLCLTTAQPLVAANVALTKSVPPDLPLVYSDRDKIKQILLNLLSNAAKFTHEGQIVVEVSKPRSDSQLATYNSDSQLIIEVKDTGIGMTAEQLGRVFEEFQQADVTTTRQYGGTGLGLPISKQLAQLLGGDLTAESEDGAGSVFTLTLPLRYEEDPS